MLFFNIKMFLSGISNLKQGEKSPPSQTSISTLQLLFYTFQLNFEHITILILPLLQVLFSLPYYYNNI